LKTNAPDREKLFQSAVIANYSGLTITHTVIVCVERFVPNQRPIQRLR